MISEKLSTDSRRMLQKGVPQFVGFCRCTLCRQRRGKARTTAKIPTILRCTPCRQRRGKGKLLRPRLQVLVDAPRAGSAEAKSTADMGRMRLFRCTPCRQRRGKGIYRIGHGLRIVMHPVQAAPRQRRLLLIWLPPVRMHPVQAAPRQRRLR